MSNPERKLFKDWFDREAAERLAEQVGLAWSKFDRKRFVKLATEGLEELEFQGRVRQFSKAMADTLPNERSDALRILRESLPPAQVDTDSVTDGWLQWPVGQFIAEHGLGDFDEAWETMVELTKRFSSEFAVRPFLETMPEQVFPRLLDLTADPNPHVRRWCSEGPRPRLPWGRKLHDLIADPSPVWPILEALRDDPEKYVQKSVANHLNDLAKDHPGAVVAVCRRWMENATPQRVWIIRHALRTLIKDGDPEALEIVGFGKPKGIAAELSVSPEAIAIGGKVEIVAGIRSSAREDQRLAVDYVLHYVRQGGRISEKVFKWKELDLPAADEVSLTKQQAFRPVSIRALYPGLHRIELQVNGHRVAEAAVELLP